MLEHLLAPAYDTQNFMYCHDTAGLPIGRHSRHSRHRTGEHACAAATTVTGAIFAASAARCWPAPPVTRAGHQPLLPALPPASAGTAPLLPSRRHRPHCLRWRQTGDLRTGGGHYTRPNAWPSAPPPRGAVSMMEGSALHQRRAIEALAGSHGRPYRGPPLGLQSGGGGAGRRLRLGTGPSQRLPRKQEGGGGRRKAMRHSGESRACSEG